MREFTLYLSTRWDMVLEREAFKTVAAPALKEILDSRGVTFGYTDVRSDMSAEDLQTPQGINAVLVSKYIYIYIFHPRYNICRTISLAPSLS